jgi:hypothetical protein
MNLIQSLAVLAFGGVILAGCNPNKDEPDPAAADPTTQDESAAPAAPTEMPPPSPTDTMPPAEQPVPPTTEPAPEPAPPPNG